MSRSALRGLTLIEVLIAIAIIGITFGVLATTQVSNLRISAAARAESRATAEANMVLEQVVACVIASHGAFESALANDSDCEPDPGPEVQIGRADVSLSGDAEVPLGDIGMVRVTVTVTEPSRVVFSRLLSCIDVQPPPAIASPTPCLELEGD